MKIKVNELKEKLNARAELLQKEAMREAEPILTKMVELQKQLDAINEKHREQLIESTIIQRESWKLGSVSVNKYGDRKFYVFAKKSDLELAEQLLNEKPFAEKFKEWSVNGYCWEIEADI